MLGDGEETPSRYVPISLHFFFANFLVQFTQSKIFSLKEVAKEMMGMENLMKSCGVLVGSLLKNLNCGVDSFEMLI